jgi:hypothetical protein
MHLCSLGLGVLSGKVLIGTRRCKPRFRPHQRILSTFLICHALLVLDKKLLAGKARAALCIFLHDSDLYCVH